MDLAELLRSGDLDAFHDARERSGRIELVAEELAELDLKGVDLTGVVLDKSDLTGSNLTDATLVRASLCEIDGEGLILDGVLAMGAKLRGAWMEGADLTGADFSHGDVTEAVLHRSKGEGLRMLATKAREIQAHEAAWPLADLSEAQIKGAELVNADLSKAKLTETQAHGADLSGATLDGADGAGFKLVQAKAVGARFVGARLVGAQFAGTDLSGADFSGADLGKADFTGAVLTGAVFAGARLVEAVLDGAQLTDVNLEGCDLTGVDVDAIGLSDEVVATLAAHGARFDPDAAWVMDDAEVAVSGHGTAVVWLNPDLPDKPTLRWAVWDGKRQHAGVLAAAGSAVLFHTMVPAGDGFRIVAVVDRAGGSQIVTWPLSMSGEVGRSERSPLPYEPAVLPVVRAEAGAVWMWGLARRGPTIVVHKDALDGQGFQVISSEGKPQARGFLGRRHPVLVCKGGVAMAVGAGGLGPPRRTPDGFPSRTSVAAPTADGLVAVWGTPARVRDPGGLRGLDLSTRGSPDPEELSDRPDVLSLDAAPDADGAWVAWVDTDEDELAGVWVARVPGGRPRSVALGDGLAVAVRIVEVGQQPCLAVTRADGGLVVGDADGKVRWSVGGES